MNTRTTILVSTLAAVAVACGPGDGTDRAAPGETGATPGRQAAGESSPGDTAAGPTPYSAPAVRRGLADEDSSTSAPRDPGAHRREPAGDAPPDAKTRPPTADPSDERYGRSTRPPERSYRAERDDAGAYDGRRRRPPGSVIRRQQHERRQRLSRQDQVRRQRMDRLQRGERRLPPVAGAPGVVQADVRRPGEQARAPSADRAGDRFPDRDGARRFGRDTLGARPGVRPHRGVPGAPGWPGYGSHDAPPWTGGPRYGGRNGLPGAGWPGTGWPGAGGGFLPGGYGSGPHGGPGGYGGYGRYGGYDGGGYGRGGFGAPGLYMRFWGEGWVPLRRGPGLLPCPRRRIPDHFFRWDSDDLFRWDDFRFDEGRRWEDGRGWGWGGRGWRDGARRWPSGGRGSRAGFGAGCWP